MDLGQGEVVVDPDGLDGAQIGDPVLVRQQVSVVDSHLILAAGAEDLNLQQGSTRPSEHLSRTGLLLRQWCG